MSRKLIIPEYSHRGIVISIYHSGDRFSAHFLLNRPPKKRIERRSELEAVEAARHIIDEAIRNGEASAQEQSVDQILQKWKLTPLQGACLLDQTLAKLAPFEVKLETVIENFVSGQTGAAITVQEVADEFLALKASESGKRHCDDLTSRLKAFCRAFGAGEIRRIARSDVSRWLDNLKVESRTRSNYRGAIVQLFRFAREREYLPDDKLSVAERVRRPKAKVKDPQIFSPEELKKLISASIALGGSGLIPLVIQAFAGIRSEEICSDDEKKDRLRWDDIRLQDKEPEIHVRGEVAKTNKPRYVFLPKALASWLDLFGQDSQEQVFPHHFQAFYKTNQRLSKKSGVK